MEIIFSKLPVNKKIEVCSRCQKILGQSFPNSEYTLTQENLASGLVFYKKLIDTFKGDAFECEGAVVFFKRATLENLYDRQGEFLKMIKAEHVPKGNCLFIDFMAAEINEKNTPELEKFFLKDDTIEFVMASRRGNIMLETIDQLRAKASRMKSTEKFISSLAL